MERHPRCFRSPCPSAHGYWFYPDFLGRLTDTRLLVMEYKGGYLEPFDSRKRQMGLAWQRAMNGQEVFLWIGDSAETSRGRSIAQQIQGGLRGGGAAHTMMSGRRGRGLLTEHGSIEPSYLISEPTLGVGAGLKPAPSGYHVRRRYHRTGLAGADPVDEPVLVRMRSFSHSSTRAKSGQRTSGGRRRSVRCPRATIRPGPRRRLAVSGDRSTGP
jgi:hypothetical protein